MKTRPLIFTALFIGALLFSAPLLGQPNKTVYATGSHVMGDLESKADARRFAMHDAKRLAVEEAGTYLESLTIVKNSLLVKDEVLALAASLISATVLDEKWGQVGENLKLVLKIKAVVDTSVLRERIAALKKDQRIVEDYKRLQKDYKELKERFTGLERKYRAAKDEPGRKRLVQDAKKASDELSAAEWFEQGNESGTQGRFDDATKYYTRAIELKPDYGDAYNNRGVAWEKKGRYDRAIKDYTKAIELAPDYANTYRNRGNAWYAKGRYDRAMKDYDKAIELKPDYAFAYIGRGVAWEKKGRYDRAIEDYTKGIELNPDYARAYYNRGNARGGKGDYYSAIKDYTKAIELKPDYAKAYYNRGVAWDEKGRSDRAIEDYTKAIELKPDFALAYYNRGIAWEKKGRYDRAREDFKRACDLGDQEGCEEYRTLRGR